MTGDKRPKILIVEDEGVTATSIKTILMVKYRVLPITVSAETAMEQIKREKPDIVLMDIILKGNVNGIELTRKVKAMHPDIVVIYITGNTDEATMREARATNPFDILAKPVYSSDIIDAVERAIRR